MRHFPFRALKRAWGVVLLWPAVFLFYANWSHATWWPALVEAAVVLGVSVIVWGVFCGLYRSVEKGSIAYIFVSSLSFLGMLFLQKTFLKPFMPFPLWQEVVGYTCVIGLGVGGGIWAAAYLNRPSILKFLHFSSMGLFLLNGMVWPLYRAFKRAVEREPKMERVHISPSPPLRSVYVLLLDEHPSPAVVKEILPQADTFLFRLGQRGFFYNDSLWADPASTLHILAKAYQVTKGIKGDTIEDGAFLRNAGLLSQATKKGYCLKGLWPCLGYIQQLPIQWEGNWLFSWTFVYFPWTKPISGWIKYRYDKAFVEGMKKLAVYLPEKPTFYHLHVFLTHFPYSTGKGGTWQPLWGYSFREHVRNAISYTHQVVLEFVDTVLATYRKAHRPEPVILVFSDHGWRTRQLDGVGVANVSLRRRLEHQAFLAAYLPDWDTTAARAAVEAVQDYEALAALLRQILGIQACSPCNASEKLSLPTCGYMWTRAWEP